MKRGRQGKPKAAAERAHPKMPGHAPSNFIQETGFEFRLAKRSSSIHCASQKAGFNLRISRCRLEVRVPNTSAKNMKSKQLANVLIRILGLSLCVQAAMHFVNGMISMGYSINMNYPTNRMGLWSNFLTGAILAAIGICFLVKSRNVTECLFKGEDE
jgi:hypothetical protein